MRSESVHKMLKELEGVQRNRWFKVPEGEFYLRKVMRCFEYRTFPTLDIANVNIKLKQRGAGAYTEYLGLFEQLAPEYGYRAVYLESVLNPQLINFYLSRGYRRVPHQGLPPCYFKLLGESRASQTEPAMQQG